MSLYEEKRDARSKRTVWLLDLLGETFVSRGGYDSTSTPGLRIRNTLQAEIDLASGKLDLDEIEAELLDRDGSVGSWLAENDATLRGAAATLRYGFVGVPETQFRSLTLYVEDWGQGAKGAFSILLRTALSFLDRPLFEDFGTGNEYGLVANLAPEGMEIRLKGKVDEEPQLWRDTGYLLLQDSETHEIELASYTALAPYGTEETRVTLSGRRLFGTGATTKTFVVNTTQVSQAWAFRDDPISVFLRLATTTDDGSNGVDDAGDGDGLGDKVPASSIDRDALVDIRDSRLLDETGQPRDALYIETGEIESLLGYFEEEFLCLGFRLSSTAEGKLTLRRFGGLGKQPDDSTASRQNLARLTETPQASEDVSNKFALDDKKIVPFKRRYPDAENNARWEYDYHPATGEYLSAVNYSDPRSEERYGKAKLRSITSRGLRGRGGRPFQLPDLGWDRYLTRRGPEYVIELGNPSQAFNMPGFVALQDKEPGDLLTFEHPARFDLTSGLIGLSERVHLVEAVDHRPSKGQVGLRMRERLRVGRPVHVGRDPYYTQTPLLKANFTLLGGEEYEDAEGETWETVLKNTLYGATNSQGTVYGWVSPSGLDSRNRNEPLSPDERYDSFIFYDNDGAAQTFRVKVEEEKLYWVEVGVGDPWNPQLNTIRVNGFDLLLDEETTALSFRTERALVGPKKVGSDWVLDFEIGGGDYNVGVSYGGIFTCVNYIQVDEVVPDAGFEPLYRLNLGPTVDPYGWNAVAEKEDDWKNVDHLGEYPLPRLSLRDTHKAGWLSLPQPVLYINRDSGSSPSERFDSFVYAPNRSGGVNKDGPIFRLTTGRRDWYLVEVCVGDATAAKIASVSIKDPARRGSAYDTRIFIDNRTEGGAWTTRAVPYFAENGFIDLMVGGRNAQTVPFSNDGYTPVAWVRVWGHTPKQVWALNLRQHDATKHDETDPVHPGYGRWLHYYAYDAGRGFGALTFPSTNASRCRKDDRLRTMGYRWDSFIGLVHDSGAGGVPTETLDLRVDVPNGTYRVVCGMADIYFIEWNALFVDGGEGLIPMWKLQNYQAAGHSGYSDPTVIEDVPASLHTPTVSPFVRAEVGVKVTQGYLRFQLGDGSTDAGSSRLGWIVIEQRDYNLADEARRQYGHISPDAGVFADGGAAYDMGV